VEASWLLADMTMVDARLQRGKEQLRKKEWLVV